MILLQLDELAYLLKKLMLGLCRSVCPFRNASRRKATTDGERTPRVFAVQRKVLDAGHWEAYNMFMLREGRPEEFKAWLQDHESDLIAYFEFMGAEDEE